MDTASFASSGVPSGGNDVVRLVAPLAGWLVPLADVPDPVFSGKVLGDGFAIDPTTPTLTAPFDGTVISVHRARHAVTLRATNGAEVLMHIGLDTVALKGDGFTAHVKDGDSVKAGDPLVTFDMDVMAQLVRSLVVPVILTNGEDFALSPVTTDREVPVGEVLAVIAPAGRKVDVAAELSGDVVRRTVVVRDPHGIHARPAGLIAEAAKAAGGAVSLAIDDRKANAASPVALMLLGAEFDDIVAIEAAGPGAAEAVEKIAALLSGAEIAPAAKPVAAPTPAAPARAAAAPLAAGASLDFDGVTASVGLAVGTSVVLTTEAVEVAETGGSVEAELEALRSALDTAAAALKAAIAASTGAQAEILAAHLSFVEDPDLRNVARMLIRDGKSAGFGWKSAIDRQVTALRRLGNAVLAERAADLEDVQHRVLKILAGADTGARALPEAAVLIAADILPSQLTELDLGKVAGIVLAEGGPTAHVAILAAARGIPAIVAAGPVALSVPDGQVIVVDADAARVRVNPPAEEVAEITATAERRKVRASANRAAAQADTIMADGTRIEVVANLGGYADVAVALENGAEGCGLLRTEFLFLNRTAAPSEDEQYAEYQKIATALNGRPLIIRTLDAGADKDVPYAELPRDENPALGLRGVRIGLLRPDLMRAQIRAILRVEPFGQVKLLLPMVATLEDLADVRTMIDAESAALGRSHKIEVGIMVEVPSAALIAARFAEKVDFFSVGTNDLTQYTLAMDRMNARLARQLDPFHPAVLSLISIAAQGGKAKGRWTGVCGSLASVPAAAPLLIGLGVTELSASAGAIADIKALVRTLDMERCVTVARHALTLESGAAVRRLIAETFPETAA